MKARSKELRDRAVAATLAAIEVYNTPCFPYRAESFAVLAINGNECPQALSECMLRCCFVCYTVAWR